MKAILDRHAARLTSAERTAVWEKISNSAARAPQLRSRWTMPAVAAATAAVAVVFVLGVLQHTPVRERIAAPPAPGATRWNPDAVTPAPAPADVRPRAAAGEPSGERVRTSGRRATSAGDVARPTVEAPRGAPPLNATYPTNPVAGSGPSAAAVPTPVSGQGVLAGRVVDAHGQPVPFATVAIPGTRRGTLTDANGVYRLEGLPAGTYDVKVQALGYDALTSSGVRVEAGAPATSDMRLTEKVVKQVEEITISAERRLDTKSSATQQTISPEKLREIPVDHLRSAVQQKAGVVAQGGELHFRGGRGGDVRFQFDGATAAPQAAAPVTPQVSAPPPPVVPTTGGSVLPNDEAFDSMFFRHYGVNPFVAADEDALSTFAVDVDNGSYTLVRRYLNLATLPPAEAVRVEECVNYFAQGYPRFETDDFRIVVDGSPSPFGPGYALLRIGIKGREVSERNRKPAQLTFVIDVSGSMAREDRLELVKRALRLLVEQLHAGDRVGIVVFGTTGRVLLDPVAIESGDDDGATRVAGRERLLAAIEQLRPEGSTNAADGLRLGYEMARRAFRPHAINRVVLCSDGVANQGLTGAESILAQVRREADRGIHLSTIGFGMGNYNDVLLEQLADRGDGNHYYVDEIKEARRVFVENLTGTLQTIAKDAKVQVEFDSTRVLRYRLIGFENRDVADRDFRNDKVDAGEIGAGHEVTALYEVKLAPHVTRGTLATVRFRWARPEHEGAGAPQVREIAQRFDVASLARRFEDAAPRLRLDAAVAEFAEILRGSYWAKDGRLADVLPVARDAARELGDEPSREFVTLVEKAATLKPRATPGASGR